MIVLTAVPKDRVLAEWRWMEGYVRSSIRKVKRFPDTMPVLRQLRANGATAYKIEGDAEGVLILCVHDAEVRWLQFEYLAGKAMGNLKSRVAMFNGMMPQFEQAARDEKCTELRVYGRPAWSRVLTGFTSEMIAGERVLRRKVSDA